MSSKSFADNTRVRLGLVSGGLRFGIVQDRDLSLARVRVSFDEFDQLLSFWLPVVTPKTQDDKFYWLPDIGEQVVCLMDERDEAGVVLGAIYSQADGTPIQSADKSHIAFKDGTTLEYDRSTHVLKLSFQDSTEIKYDSGHHLLSFAFEDQAAMKYDASAHRMVLSFSDTTVISYDAAAHNFSIAGVTGASVAVSAPAGITLTSGPSYINIAPAGVTVHTLLP